MQEQIHGTPRQNVKNTHIKAVGQANTLETENQSGLLEGSHSAIQALTSWRCEATGETLEEKGGTERQKMQNLILFLQHPLVESSA